MKNKRDTKINGVGTRKTTGEYKGSYDHFTTYDQL